MLKITLESLNGSDELTEGLLKIRLLLDKVQVVLLKEILERTQCALWKEIFESDQLHILTRLFLLLLGFVSSELLDNELEHLVVKNGVEGSNLLSLLLLRRVEPVRRRLGTPDVVASRSDRLLSSLSLLLFGLKER